MFALIEAHRAGLYRRAQWLPNVMAGLVTGTVAIPLAMAFAIASGAKPEQGLYTGIAAGLLVALFGGSRFQIAGPTGAFVAILASVTTAHGIEGLQIATVMAGAILLLLGVTRLGGIIKFIPHPVIVGFTAGIGVIIWVGQWRYFFGLGAVGGEHFHERLWHLIQAFPGWHPATTGVALLSLALVIVTPWIPGLRRIPGTLVAMIVATVVQLAFKFEGIATIGSTFGGIPVGLPLPSVPEITFQRVLELIGPAFAIAMLGAIESLLSAIVADGMTGTKHDSNQELIGQGLANMVAPLFGGFAATGALARTATSIRAGATSPIAGIVQAATLAAVVIALAPLTDAIPLAALAAILFVVAWNMSEARHVLRLIRRAPRADSAILVITFLLTVFADLTVAVNIGVILATLHFLRQMASSVEITAVSDHDIHREFAHHGFTTLPPGVMVFAIDGPFFFGAVEHLEQALAQTHTDPRRIILRLKWVPFIDVSGLQALDEVIGNLQRRGVAVMLSGARPEVHAKLAKAGIVAKVGADNCFAEFREALTRAVELAQAEPVSGHGSVVMMEEEVLSITGEHDVRH